MKQLDLRDAFAVVREYVDGTWPGNHGLTIMVDLGNGRQAVLPVPHGGAVPASALTIRPTSTPSEGEPGRNHSPDFRAVNYYGHLFRFTAGQAAIVRLLWEAAESNTFAVGQAALLEAADCRSGRLHDVFKRSAAWGTLIVPAEQPGTFRLATRDEIDEAMVSSGQAG